jgi:glycosyl hydrolase family 79
LTVTSAVSGRPIPAGFVGLSIEYTTLEIYAGQHPGRIDPVFKQLVRNLAPGQRPIMRIGGDTTDWTWMPIPGVARPPWVRFSLTPTWLHVARTFARSVHARLTPSINLEASSPAIAMAEGHALLDAIGRQNLYAFEVGNEPELYPSFPWYLTSGGTPIFGRPRTYDFKAYERDYSGIAASLPLVPLAGPSTGARSQAWRRPLAGFLRDESRVRLVTLHRYALDNCGRHPNPVPSVMGLMSNGAARGLAHSVADATRVAHARHIPLRIEELNAVSCGGLHGVSDVLASALWALDMLFESDQVEVDGVNFHTHEYGLQSLFRVRFNHGRWTAAVKPEYYGLLMFARAVPPGSRLLRITGTTGTQRLHVWATRGTDGRIRVVLINKDPSHSDVVSLRVPGTATTGTLERLTGPSLDATHGVKLGGHSFGAETSTGVLPTGQSAVTPSGDQYRVSLPSASAALLIVSSR